jgi:hypothetical protein
MERQTPNRSPVLSERFVPSHRRSQSGGAELPDAKRHAGSTASSSWQGGTATENNTSASASNSVPVVNIPTLSTPLLPINDSDNEDDSSSGETQA